MELVRVALGDPIRDCPVDTAGGEIDLSTLNSYESPMQCPVDLETSRLVVEPYMMSFGLIMLTVNVRDAQNTLFQKRSKCYVLLCTTPYLVLNSSVPDSLL
ncbi:hypothetical protein ElyMa_005261600 [Elysia marginata]|uniref:Uncharacterized protein n=1 Tax=Elysia marginata TaxID=1093978 RepID=A0AAV4JYD7_9GAST|nr:hypothetical protein ElyMa_005261600 [Elysia marginata]